MSYSKSLKINHPSKVTVYVVSIKLLDMWWNCLYISPVKHNSVSGSKNKHNSLSLCVLAIFAIYSNYIDKIH
jgi:hypothetical protein